MFADEDLKRLKECIHPISGLDIALFHSPKTTMTKFDLVALLARLECAEEIHKNHAGHNEDCDEANSGDRCSCGFEAAEIKWCKAAGKGEGDR